MRVYLSQHGQAKSKQVDPQPDLTDKGRRDVEKVTAFLRPLNLQVEAIWHSGKARARQTAEVLASGVTAAQGVVEHEGLAPKDPPEPIRQAIEAAEGDLFIVGHLPFLGGLSASLVAGTEQTDVVAMQQGCVVCLEQAENQNWRVAWMVVPDALPS